MLYLWPRQQAISWHSKVHKWPLWGLQLGQAWIRPWYSSPQSWVFSASFRRSQGSLRGSVACRRGMDRRWWHHRWRPTFISIWIAALWPWEDRSGRFNWDLWAVCQVVHMSKRTGKTYTAIAIKALSSHIYQAEDSIHIWGSRSLQARCIRV